MFSVSGKAKIGLALVCIFLVALLATVFAKTVTMAWLVIKILAIVVLIGAAIYFARGYIKRRR